MGRHRITSSTPAVVDRNVKSACSAGRIQTRISSRPAVGVRNMFGGLRDVAWEEGGYIGCGRGDGMGKGEELVRNFSECWKLA